MSFHYYSTRSRTPSRIVALLALLFCLSRNTSCLAQLQQIEVEAQQGVVQHEHQEERREQDTTQRPPRTRPPRTLPPGRTPPPAIAADDTPAATDGDGDASSGGGSGGGGGGGGGGGTTTTSASAEVSSDWEGCIDPNGNEQDNLVTIGQRTTICLILARGADWKSKQVMYIRLSFQPIADEFSRLHIPNSYRDLVRDGESVISEITSNITVHVESQKRLSYQKIYFTPIGRVGKVFPYLTAKIDVRDGVVDGIVWDDACMFCGGANCEENTYDYSGALQTEESAGQHTKGCFIREEDCNRYVKDERTDCDVTLHVVWSGTDSNGFALESNEVRFSAFESRRLQDRLEDNIPKFPDSLNFFKNNN